MIHPQLLNLQGMPHLHQMQPLTMYHLVTVIQSLILLTKNLWPSTAPKVMEIRRNNTKIRVMVNHLGDMADLEERRSIGKNFKRQGSIECKGTLDVTE